MAHKVSVNRLRESHSREGAAERRKLTRQPRCPPQDKLPGVGPLRCARQGTELQARTSASPGVTQAQVPESAVITQARVVRRVCRAAVSAARDLGGRIGFLLLSIRKSKTFKKTTNIDEEMLRISRAE